MNVSKSVRSIKKAKGIKYVFLGCIALMVILVAALLASTKDLGTLGEDGYALPENTVVLESLRAATPDVEKLVSVSHDDTVYSAITGYFVGDKRTRIDSTFPLYINGGTGLRFLGEENWLISTDVTLLRSYEGMYLADGTTFNSDMTQADAEEFILLSLPNGLYMNAQHAVFENLLESFDIPVNSIIHFGEDAVRWYYKDGGSLVYESVDAVFGASITIGGNTYLYNDLLKALGLISEALERIEDGENVDDVLQQAETVLNGENPKEEKDETQKDKDKTVGTKPAAGTVQAGQQPGQGAQGNKDTQAGDDDKADSQDKNENDNKDNNNKTPGNEGQPSTTPGTTQNPNTGTDSNDQLGDPEQKPGEGGDGENKDPGDNQDPGDGDGQEGDNETEGDNQGGGDGESGDGEPGEGGGDNDSDTDSGSDQDPGEGGGEVGDNDSDSEYDPDVEPGDSTGPTPGGSEAEPGDGEYIKPPYRQPVVSLSELEPWCYAVSGHLSIKDVSGALQRGVRISVYSSISQQSVTGDKAYTDAEGNTVYPVSNYEGRSTILRKSFNSSQDFAVSTLPPNTTVYVQFSYRYIAESVEQRLDEETGQMKDVTIYKRISYESDLVELKTGDNSSVYPVYANWSEVFAADAEGLRLEQLVLQNTSGYDPDMEQFDLENFKKNTLNYVNRLEFTLTPENGGESVVINTSSTVLRNAQNLEGGAVFSSSGQLESNTKYTYTVKALDRYNNEITLNKGQGYTGTLYTRKQLPTVEIEEVENVADKLTLKVRISDPDGAIISETPEDCFRLSMVDLQGAPAQLYGTWKNGSALSTDENGCLVLENAKDGAEYEFTLESLAFGMYYNANVSGCYQLQPDFENTPAVLPAEHNAPVGTERFYTAALSDGNVNYNVSMELVSDTYAHIGFTMNSRSTLDILPMMDAVRIRIKDADGNVMASQELTMEELGVYEGNDYVYDDSTDTITLTSGDPAEKIPGLTLSGSKDQFTGLTLWDSMLVRLVTDDEGGSSYSQPMKLSILLQPGTLDTSTRYYIEVESVVFKSGIEYTIPTFLSSEQFTTTKIQPTLKYDDFLVAGDVAEFIGLEILDEDGTILSGGHVQAYLYYGSTILEVRDIYTNSDPQSLRFEGIINGEEYSVVFFAPSYNDTHNAATLEQNYRLWTMEFVGSGGITGKLNLQNLMYSSIRDGENEFVSIGAAEAAEKLASGAWAKVDTTDRYWTDYYEVPAGATYIRAANLTSGDETAGVAGASIRFYDANKTQITVNGDKLWTNKGVLLAPVPENAVYCRFIAGTRSALEQNGLYATYFTYSRTDDLIDYSAYEPGYFDGTKVLTEGYSAYRYYYNKIKVSPGDLYVSDRNAYIYLWSEGGSYVGALSNQLYTELVIPNGVGYVSFAITEANVSSGYTGFHKVAEAVRSEGYQADVSVYVNDTEGYLASGETEPVATVNVYRSASMNQPQYDSAPWLSQQVPLSQSGEEWIADYVQILRALEPDSGWRMTLSIEYQGSVVVLDEITFNTDGPYYIISNQQELYNVRFNPYANYLCTADFSVTMTGYPVGNLYGNIDFQGHVIRLEAATTNLIYNVSRTASIRNLVVDIPAGTNIDTPIIYTSTGLIENLIVRTEGSTVLKSNAGLIVFTNYGTMRNFILRMGGDVYIAPEAGSNVALVARYNWNILENGYVYGADGAGVVYTRVPGGYYGGVVTGPNMFGSVKNVYTVFESWHPTSNLGDDGYKTGAFAQMGYGPIENVYHVGDYYLLGSGGEKTYNLVNDQRFGAQAVKTLANAWHVSNNSYTNSLPGYQQPNAVTAPVLYDTVWQSSVLGDAFSYSSRFYPRLNLPTEMQRYQEYLPLPILADSTAPQPVSDSWAEGFPRFNERGTVLLRMKNDLSLTVKDVTFEGLHTDGIISQQMAEDGMYDVVVAVSVPEDGEYLSAYPLTSIRYNNGAGDKTIRTSYTTSSFEFFKEVSTLSQWAAIDENLEWNYRLVADLDFASESLTPAQIKINGSLTDVNATGKFLGKLDGGIYDENGDLTGLHTIKNITLTTLYRPCVINGISGDAVVQNLVVDNLQLTASGDPNGYCGFIAVAEQRSIVENVHIRNSALRGAGYVAPLLADSHGNAGVFNCSVADTQVYDQSSTLELNMGGIVGYNYNTNLRNCYTRNVSLSAENSNNILGVGGIIGVANSARIANCYATGTILTGGSSTGGILGRSANDTLNSCWTDVDIIAKGGSVGGINGVYIRYGDSGNLAVGNIIAGGSDVHRITGVYNESNNVARRNFAYAGQSVSGVMDGDADDAKRLITGDELAIRSTWTDIIEIGTSYSFASLEDGAFPKIYTMDGSSLVYGQTDIPLPGQGGDHVLVITEAKAEGGKYYLNARWEHPGYDSAELLDIIRRQGVAGENLSISLDGMRFDDDAINDGIASIGLSPMDESGQVSSLTIVTGEHTKALNNFRLTVEYDNHSLMCVVDYGVKLYNEVPNLSVWNQFMASGRGTTEENFLITGKVDFNGASPAYLNLKLGDLVGQGGDTGFYNMGYSGSYTGEPWIESVGAVSDLKFSGISADFKDVSATNARDRNGLILSANSVDNCVFDSIRLKVNNYSVKGFGFFSTINGRMSNVTASGLRLEKTGTGTATDTYAAPLASRLVDGFENLTVKDVVVDMPLCRVVGGVFGNISNSSGKNLASTNGQFSDIQVSAQQYVGGIAYRVYKPVDWVLEDFSVNASYYSAAAVAYTSAGDVNGLTVKNGSVTAEKQSSSATYVSTICDQTNSWTSHRNIHIENVDFTGKNYVGAFLGIGSYNYIFYVNVIGCNIVSQPDNNSYDLNNTGAGGILGRYDVTSNDAYYWRYLVVRDTTVTAVRNAGGIVGTARAARVMDSYVAEDVVVTSSAGSAGGVAGYATIPIFNRVACGATVSGGNVAGGLVGVADWSGGIGASTNFDQVYYHGSVSSPAYAAALIGSTNSTAAFDSSIISSAVTAGTVSGGAKASMWVNNISTSDITPGDGNVLIWDESILNGQTVAALKSTADAMGAQNYYVPSSGELVSAEQLKTQKTWTDWGFSSINLDYSSLETYMPFTKQDGSVSEYVNKDASGNSAGILQPNGSGVQLDLTDVYAVDADKITIELGSGLTAIEVNGTVYDSEDGADDGILTLSYNFNSALTVGGKSYDPESLRRTVMLSGDYWYYIDGGLVYYGTGVQDEAKPTVSGISGAVHMYKNHVIDDQGNVYSLSGGTATLVRTLQFMEVMADTPYYSSTVLSEGAMVPFKTYHDFTLYGTEKLSQRLFLSGSRVYAVSPLQATVYDGVMLTDYYDGANNFSYFALLGNNGEILNYGSSWISKAISTEGIAHMSNNFSSTKPIILLRYENGQAVGYDYSGQGTLLFTTASTQQSFMDYVENGLDNILSSFKSNTLQSDTGFMESSTEAEFKNSIAESTEDPSEAQPGTSDAPESDITEAVDGENHQLGDSQSQNTISSQVGSIAQSDGTNPSTGVIVGLPGTSTLTGSSAESGTGLQPGSAALASLPAEGSFYVEGQGLIVDGEQVYTEGEMEYVPNDGVYVDGEKILSESLDQSAAQGASSSGGAKVVALVKPQVYRQQLMKTLGNYMAVYDPETGEYVAAETSELIKKDKPERDEAKPLASLDTAENGELTVGAGLGRSLSAAEKRGVMLIGTLSLIGFVILSLLYVKFIRKKLK